jgi:hypothetical protein
MSPYRYSLNGRTSKALLPAEPFDYEGGSTSATVMSAGTTKTPFMLGKGRQLREEITDRVQHVDYFDCIQPC